MPPSAQFTASSTDPRLYVLRDQLAQTELWMVAKMTFDTNRQTVYQGEGALSEVVRIIDEQAVGRLLLVVDEAAYAASGGEGVFKKCCADLQVERFAGFELNPKLHDVRAGIDLHRRLQPDMVIGFGGGTAIDLAKLIGTLAAHDDDARDIITGRGAIEKSGPPMIAIPTTAGTGSEATQFAVTYVDGEKYSVSHPLLLPDFAIVDPKLTHSMPPKVTAASGLDALCQGIESVWSVAATEQSVGWATEAIRLATEHLQQAVERPTSQARRGMCRAAHLSGQAINITRTTASHALSYAITTDYGLPHGMAVALTLAPMLAYNAAVTESDCNDPRGPQAVLDRIALILESLQADNVAAACGKIRGLISAIGCPIALAEIGVADDVVIERLVSRVNAERLSNNPRKTTAQALVSILKGSAGNSVDDQAQ
jgi:alcohol dehydrogenase class IV